MAHAPQPLASERHFLLAWDTYGVRIEQHLASRLMSHDAIAASVSKHLGKGEISLSTYKRKIKFNLQNNKTMFNLFKKKNAQTIFNNWITEITINEKPSKDIIAYNIGLIETPKGYNAYFMGAKEYDEIDSDWACDFGDFTPKNKYLDLSNTELTKLKWEEVQICISNYTKEFLKTKAYEQSFLKESIAITVGFDEGDLIKIK